MRKLNWTMSLNQLRSVKNEVVPALFTKHQFHLIEDKLSGKELTPTERSEFSRSISRKMKAVYALLEKETDSVFISSREKIKPERLALAIRYLKEFSRTFKNKHVFLTGSFLYQEKYHDIDIFVVSKYEKDDYLKGTFHINYLTKEAYHSLFFASARQLCISNRKIPAYDIKEMITLDTLISLYQELFNDLDRHFAGVKKTLREFLLQAAYLSQLPIPDSAQLNLQIEKITTAAKSKEIIKKIFVQSTLLSAEPKKAIPAMKIMISSYHNLMKEYHQHKKYYKDLVTAFQEVVTVAG